MAIVFQRKQCLLALRKEVTREGFLVTYLEMDATDAGADRETEHTI